MNRVDAERMSPSGVSRIRAQAAFTLIEAVLVLAVLAVIAGMMAPYAVKEIEASRREATQRELGAIEDGLLAYYRDCGVLPSEKTGLVALVKNAAGHPDWNGPYVGGSGDIEVGITQDAWGESYTYVLAPQLKGSGITLDYLVLSPGADRTLGTKLTGKKWELDTAGDLLLQGLTQTIDLDWEALVDERLDEYENGLRDYYLDVGAFPSGNDSVALAALVTSVGSGWSGPYVRETLATIARDPWGAPIILRTCSEVNGHSVSGWLLLSYGAGPPDARVTGTRWVTGRNDLFRVISSNRLQVLLNQERLSDARRELQLVKAEILVNNPTESPPTGPLSQKDPWGRAYVYTKKAATAGVVYSYGADGLDDGTGDDDIYEPILWPGAGS
ncbi:MAG: hypothetical protein GF330_00670 [Candidatus Eisenbacteria bacterium]|nr:hypothetical protein [Candidatus Eisenbacteria bacterium]